MAFATIDGSRVFFRLEGRPDAPLLVLGNSLGTDTQMWDRQTEALTAHFRLLKIDARGHGASDVPAADLTVERLARDVLALVDGLGVARFAYCGVSLGAMVGQWLGVHAGDRVTHLVLSNATAHLPSVESWNARIALVRRDGMEALVDAAMPRLFSDVFRTADDPYFHSLRETFRRTDADGYAACCAAVRDADFRPLLGRIAAPTLVVGGRHDVATPIEAHGAPLADAIAGARLLALDAGHLANVEQPDAFSRAVVSFVGTSR